MTQKIEVKVPGPGESVTEVEIGRWIVEDGDIVDKDQEIAEIESDKATLTVTAEVAGKIKLLINEGETISVGTIICTLDTSFKKEESQKVITAEPEEAVKTEIAESGNDKLPVQSVSVDKTVESDMKSRKNEALKITPLAKEIMKQHDLSPEELLNRLKRLGKREVETLMAMSEEASMEQSKPAAFDRNVDTIGISPLRRRLSERLVAVKNETAMLTTFNEVDMAALMELRKKYQNRFIEKHGIKLGFVSFFAKAASLAMESHPMVNSRMEGDKIITPHFSDIGIAVSTERGLVVPVIKNVESKSIPAIEQEIKELADKARNKRITVDELTGGTFTITNGGIFGSLLSTPIINPPQSAILGMHNIVERPIALDGEVVIRPMMYVALSYDHRIIDGKDSVGFLLKIKQMIEHPEQILFNGKEYIASLLGL